MGNSCNKPTACSWQLIASNRTGATKLIDRCDVRSNYQDLSKEGKHSLVVVDLEHGFRQYGIFREEIDDNVPRMLAQSQSAPVVLIGEQNNKDEGLCARQRRCVLGCR